MHLRYNRRTKCCTGDPELLDRLASNTPDAFAVLSPGRDPLTYRQLYNSVRSLQDSLASFGVEPGEVIALAMPGGPEMITAFLAAATTGACAPLDPSLTESDSQVSLKQLGAGTLIAAGGTSLAAINAARSLGMRILAIQGSVFELTHPGANPARKSGAALLLFTSATTDAPKLVPLTWENLSAMAAHDSAALKLSSSDRLLSLMPLFHLHGLATVLTQLSCGGSVISTSGFDPAKFPEWLGELRPTWFTSSPPVNRAILALARQRPEVFRATSLRFIRSGTAALDQQLLTLIEEVVGVPVLNGYGMTETGGVARNTHEFRKAGSVGRTSGLEIAIMDPAGGILLPEFEGEIVVRGSSVTSGYLDNPEANQSAFRDGWFRTGDIGHLDSEGFLFITGRLREMINRGGDKVAPHDVEAALLGHPTVAEAVACAIPHNTLGEDVAAAVVLRPGANASEAELRRFAAAQLAPFKVPRRIALVDSIPRTSTGKPKRRALAELMESTKPRRPEPAARPLQPAETILADIWRRVIGLDKVEIHDDFFALGGDSLTAAIMLAEAQRALNTGREFLSRVDFFDSPTIESLALIAMECGANPTSEPDASMVNRLLTLRGAGSQIPIFCFPASAQDPYYLRHLSQSLDDEQPFYVVCPADPVRDKRLLPVEELAHLAVEAVRRERPRGPYILGGHCYGGVLAFETALQLMSLGERIECLVLFDAATPGYPKVHKQWKRYAAKARELALSLRPGKLAGTATAVREHVYTLGRILSRGQRATASRALTAIGSDVLVAGREEKTLNGMAMWEYTPRPFRAPIIHFIAADQHVSTEVLSDPRFGWDDFASAGITVRSVRGDHNSLLAMDNAAALGVELTRLLPRRAVAPMAARA